MKVEDFLKSLQGVTADDLPADELALLKSAIGDDEPEPEAPDATGLLAKALGIIEGLAKGFKPKPGEKPDEDEEGKPKGNGKPKPDEDEDEEERRLAEAAELLAEGEETEEQKKERMNKAMGLIPTPPEDGIDIKDFVKGVLAQVREEQEPIADKQTEVLGDLVKSLQAQQETIEAQGKVIADLQKSISEMSSRPVGTQVAPFEMRKSVDTQAGAMGLPNKAGAAEVMQKAFMHCTNHSGEVQVAKAISATDVQAVEGAYASRDPEELAAVKPLLDRAQSIIA